MNMLITGVYILGFCATLFTCYKTSPYGWETLNSNEDYFMMWVVSLFWFMTVPLFIGFFILTSVCDIIHSTLLKIVRKD